MPARRRLRAVPVSLVTSGRRLLVIGGCGGRTCRVKHARWFDWSEIRVVAPPGSRPVCARCRRDPRVRVCRREARPGDVAGSALVLHGTLNAARAARAAAWCRARGVPLGTMDKPEYSDIYYTALVRRGPLLVAVATGGESPALAAVLRRWLGRRLGPGWSLAARLLSDARRDLPPGRKRRAVLRRLAGNPAFVSAIEGNDAPGMRRMIRDAFGRLHRRGARSRRA